MLEPILPEAGKTAILVMTVRQYVYQEATMLFANG